MTFLKPFLEPRVTMYHDNIGVLITNNNWLKGCLPYPSLIQHKRLEVVRNLDMTVFIIIIDFDDGITFKDFELVYSMSQT